MGKKLRSEFTNEDLGFQIAPMIDVIFVIMLFFMVKVGARQQEMEIRTKLPGSAEVSVPISGLEALEESISIDEEGNISHNDEYLERNAADPNDKRDVAQLMTRMQQLAEQAKNSKNEVVVTINTTPDTRLERITDVMDVLQAVSIKNMTFSVAEEY